MDEKNYKPGICVECGKVFKKKSGTQIVCGERCRAARHARQEAQRRERTEKPEKKATILKCLWCGKEFERGSSRQIYCCKECRKKDEREKLKKEATQYGEIECQTCGKKFVKQRWNQKYCCKECCQKEWNSVRKKGRKKVETWSDEQERKRIRNSRKEIARFNKDAREHGKSYGQAYAPAVEVHIPDSFRRMNEYTKI